MDGMPMDEFESLLVENQDKKICVITPGGNHGDTLIHLGLIKKLNSVKADYCCVNLEDICRHRIHVGMKYLLKIAASKIGLDYAFKIFNIPRGTELILFEGGGYMNDLYHGFVLLKEVLENHKTPVVVAPNSFWFKKTDFRTVLSDEWPVILFCREKYSFDIVSEAHLPKNTQVYLSQDISLYLTREELSEFIPFHKEKHDLVCLRKDIESVIPNETKQRIVEKAKEGDNNLLVADISKSGTFKDFVSAVDNADKIYTDRLHVAIMGHIFGKDLMMFDNSYHKNLGVYEYSLKENSKIRFVSQTRI